MSNNPLVPCAACERHVRALASSCPFCGEPRSNVVPPVAKVPKGRLSSLLVMTFHAAAAAATTVGCGGETADPVPPTSTGGHAGHGGATGKGGVVDNGSGGVDDGSGARNAGSGGFGSGDVTGSGGQDGAGGLVIDVGMGGDTSHGGAVPIYRATPRG